VNRAGSRTLSSLPAGSRPPDRRVMRPLGLLAQRARSSRDARQEAHDRIPSDLRAGRVEVDQVERVAGPRQRHQSMATGAGLRGTTAAASENGRHGGGAGGAPNAASSVASSVRPSRHACTAGLHKSITAAAHSATVMPVSQRLVIPVSQRLSRLLHLLRRPSHSAAAAKQTGSGTSHSAISGMTIPTGHASVPIACVQTGHGNVVKSAADANASASTSSDHRTALASRRFQGEGRIWLHIPRRVRLGDRCCHLARRVPSRRPRQRRGRIEEPPRSLPQLGCSP
jgi:hypothetical protein